MSQSAAPATQNNTTGFAASPIDTARPQENQRLETRHVGASKRAFRARPPPILTLYSFKIEVFLRVSLEPENLLPPYRGFRQFSAHLTKCHTCHGICTLSPLDAALTMRFAKNMQHDTSKVLRLPCKMTMDTSKVLRLPRTLQLILRKHRKSIAPVTQNDFRYLTKHEKRSNTAFETAEPATGTAIRGSCERLRMVANGCERLRTVAGGCARLSNVVRTHP